MFEVIEINDYRQLHQYRGAWQLLLEQTPGATFFHSAEWLISYWEHFGRDQRLRVLVVLAQGEPIGIVPLTVFREKTRVGTIRVLTYPLHDWASFYGPLGARRSEALAAALDHVRRTSRDWDLLDLRWTDREGHDGGDTGRALQSARLSFRAGVWKQLHIIQASGGWNEYIAGRTSKFRNNLRRCENRLAERGGVEYICHRPRGTTHRDDDPRWDLFEECMQVAEKSWQGSSTSGTTLSHPQVRRFFQQTHLSAAAAGMLDMHVLRVRGQPIAFAYNYHCRGYVYGLRMGYDPAYAAAGAGSVACARSFKQCLDSGDHTIDLGVGSSDIKRAWKTGTGRSYRFTHYPLSAPRSQVLRLKHGLRQWVAGEVDADEKQTAV